MHQGATINMQSIETAFECAIVYPVYMEHTLCIVVHRVCIVLHYLQGKIFANCAQDLLPTKSSAMVWLVISPYSRHRLSEICCTVLRLCRSFCMEHFQFLIVASGVQLT